MAGTGGRRAGAGRKSNAIREARRNWASAVLSDKEEIAYWRELIEQPKTRPDALKFISEHKHGKAPQAIDLSDNRSANEIDLGSLPIASTESREADKPN